MADGAVAKLCAACAKDVASLPRTKDAQGRYFCQECAAKLKAKQPQQATARPAAPKPVPVKAAAPSDGDVLSKMLADSPGVELCPNCGGGMQSNSKICIRCGFNKETGRAMRVQVEHAKKERGESKALAAAGALAAGPAALLFAAIGSLIGGAIGAGIWYGVAMHLNREIGWIAWGVGVLAGLGAAMGGRQIVGTHTGLIAAAIAAGAVLAGKYAVVEVIVSDIESAVSRAVVAEDEHAIGLIARDVAKEHQAAGKNYQWPEDSSPEEALIEDGFPPPIWTDAKARYDALDDAGKKERKDAATRLMKTEFKGAMNEFRGEGFAAMFGPIDILFFILAIGSAFSIGAGAKGVGESLTG